MNFNEPLSLTQRLTEELEYSDLLDRAACCENSLEQICYIAAFSISCYASVGIRTGKPFNPLLGETYEADRSEDMGWTSLTEQVCYFNLSVMGKRTNLKTGVKRKQSLLNFPKSEISFPLIPTRTCAYQHTCVCVSGGGEMFLF